MHIFKPHMRYVSIFVLSYYSIGLVMALADQNLEFLFYGAIMALIMGAVVWMDTRSPFSQFALWGMAIWGLVHLAGGIVPIPEAITEPGRPETLYNMRLFPWFPKMDQIVHTYGFAIATLLSYEALCAHYKRALPIGIPVAAQLIFIATGLGALNEVIEFTAVLLMPHTNVGGYINTGWDMVCNLTGSILMVLWLRAKRVPKT